LIGLALTPLEDVQRFGCVAGSWEGDMSVLNITLFKEKPTTDYAEEHLKVGGLPPDTYLSVFGIYVITPQVAAILADMKKEHKISNGELQLTDALESFRQKEGLKGYLIAGAKKDIGVPQVYAGLWK
ncbi:MAG TPA: sugar phosphate nucleotidyltransferase, partial [Spirochaetia bacterium]|nr:sugar phosphate nucleotidyltransferase [Spirochaetia bacterium]